MLSSCRDGRDTIQGRRADGVKDLRPRFTRTDIRAGQRHLGDSPTSPRCRHWQRSQAGGPHLRATSAGPDPTTSWSLVIDSEFHVCATTPHPVLLDVHPLLAPTSGEVELQCAQRGSDPTPLHLLVWSCLQGCTQLITVGATTADAAFIRAALRTIVTIGDS